MAVKRTWPCQTPPPRYQLALAPRRRSRPPSVPASSRDTLVLSRQVWSGLPPAARAQVQQTFTLVLQEVLRDGARR
jgi:hypothetical protein